MRNIRVDEMEKYIQKHETVSMTDLQKQFHTSLNTVRRDVSLLLKKGTVEKVYGGVCARAPGRLTPFEIRSDQNQQAKAAISKRAADLVGDGEVIFLDSGTTVCQMVKYLQPKRNITVITHSLEVINQAKDLSNITLIALPGQLNRQTGSFTGLDTERFLQSYNIQKAFVAATGFSLTNGISNSSPLEYELKKTVIARSEIAYLLIDTAKFGKTGLQTYASVDDFYGLITEKEPEQVFTDEIAKSGCSIILA